MQFYWLVEQLAHLHSHTFIHIILLRPIPESYQTTFCQLLFFHPFRLVKKKHEKIPPNEKKERNENGEWKKKKKKK